MFNENKYENKYRDTCRKIKHLSKQEYYQMVAKLTGQIPTLAKFKHCSYKSTFDLKLTFSQKDIKYEPYQYEPFKVLYWQKTYYVYHMGIKELLQYLDLNRAAKKRFICLPIYYYNCHIQKSHVGSVTFDLVNDEVIILESNGRHPIDFVNRLFQMLIKDMDRHGGNYRFIPLHEWLSSKRNINGSNICATCNLFLVDKLVGLADKTLLDEYLAGLTKDGLVRHLETFLDKNLIIE